MKKMKKIVAMLVAAVMCLSTISAFAAFNNEAGFYTFELKVLDAEGNVIDTAAPGEDVYVALYVYQTSDKGDIVLGTSNGTLNYHIAYDYALTADLAGADGESPEYKWADVENGEAYVLDAEDFFAMTVVGTLAKNTTYTAAAPVSKIKFTLPAEETTYSFYMIEGFFGSIDDGAIVCEPIADTEGVTLTVAAKQDDKVAADFGANNAGVGNGVAIEGTNDIYDNAYAVDVTVTPNDAEEVGVLFIPEAVATTDTEWTTAAKATFAGLGKGLTTVKAAIINIPRALEGVAFKMLAKAYAVLEGVTTYGAVSEQTINFTDTGINN